MSMKNQYPKLSRLPELLSFLRSFVGYFDGAEFVGLNESDAARLYISVYAPKTHSKIISQGHELLKDDIFPREEVSRAAYRFFINDEEAREWFQSILNIVETTEPRVGRFFIDAIPREVRKKFNRKYPRAFSFFLTEFKKYSYQELSDEETAKRYVAISSPKLITGLIEEGNAFLRDADFPWEEVNKEAAKFFAHIKDFRAWITEVLKVLKESL